MLKPPIVAIELELPITAQQLARTYIDGTGSNDFDSLMKVEWVCHGSYIGQWTEKMLSNRKLDGICLFACRKVTDTETKDSQASVCSSFFAFL